MFFKSRTWTHTWYLSFFYITAIRGQDILQLKVGKFATKVVSRHNCVKFFTLYATFCSVFCLPIGRYYTWLISFYTTSACDGCDKYQVCIILSFGYLLWSFTSVSFVSLLDWDKGFRIFYPGSHHAEDKGTIAVFKEFTQSSQNCLGHNSILRKLFMSPAGCFRGNNTIPLCPSCFISYFHFLRIWRSRRSCNSQFSISFQIACTAATPTTWCQGPTLEQKNAKARTGTRPKPIIHHLHISLPRPWPRSFYQQISCKASHQHPIAQIICLTISTPL